MNEIMKGLGTEIIYESTSKTEEEIQANEVSYADIPTDHIGLIQDSVFVGEFPLEVILEGLRNQFSNYIGTDDRTDYVDAFYKQYESSCQVAESEEFSDDAKEALSKYMDTFLATMQELFSTKLAMTLMDLEGNEINNDSAEQAIRLLYTVFILDAPETLMNVIAKEIWPEVASLDGKEYFDKIRELLSEFSPLIRAIGPMKFIRDCDNEDLTELFETGRVVGNFLRRYSPRFYKNEEFEVRVISRITEIVDLKNEINNPEGGVTNAATESIG